MDSKVFYDLTYGMFIISTKDSERYTGCVVNSVSQVTSSPSQIIVSINKNNYTMQCVHQSKKFTVSILAEDISPEVIGNFGFKSGVDFDKFQHVNYETVSNDLPVLTENICGWMICQVVSEVDVGTHVIFVAEVIDAKRIAGSPPMTYAYYRNVVKGSSPKNAPTYIDEIESERKSEHKCTICGYVYDGSEGDFKELDEDYVCPICGAKKSLFS